MLTGPKTWPAWLLALFTGRFVPRAGYTVQAKAAIEVLATRSPEAAAWWRENAAHALKAGRHFVFQEGAVRVTGSETQSFT